MRLAPPSETPRFAVDWLLEQGGLETSVSRETFGDGVNVASRIHVLAPPNGIAFRSTCTTRGAGSLPGSHAADDRQLTSGRFRRVLTRMILRLAALEDLSSLDGSLGNPAAFSRHRNSKVNDGNRTELTANSFSGGCWPISTPKNRNVHNRFPSKRLLATPTFLIPLAPAASRSKTWCLRRPSKPTSDRQMAAVADSAETAEVNVARPFEI